MAELAKGGTSRVDRTSSASTRPAASFRVTSSASSTAIASRIRSRAWATVSNGRVPDLPIVPVAVFELRTAGVAVGHDVLVEAGCNHLIRHSAWNPKFGKTLHFIGHDLVAGGLDGGDHIVERGPRLGRGTAAILGGGLHGHLDLRFLGGLRLAVLGLFSH